MYIIPNAKAPAGVRWALTYDGPNRLYVLSEYYDVAGEWRLRNRSSWQRMLEALDHIEQTNRLRRQETT